MEEERALRRTSNGGTLLNRSLLPYPTVSTTFTIPLTRYTTRLITSDRHRPLLADCAEEDHSDSEDFSRRSFIRENCSYSMPILVLDVVWNLAFVLVSIVVLLSTFKERPSTPLRLWISGYGLQCLLHVAFVFFEYQRSMAHHGFEDRAAHRSIMKRLESMNTMTSSVWWVFGFYWIVMGGQALLQDSPRLYWLTVVFLAFDLFFILFCIGMACVIFFSLCCCIPIVAFAYAMTTREGASEEDIRTLPRYTFRQAAELGTVSRGKEREPIGATVELDNGHCIKELALHPEDSECCICLSRYEDGTELYTLPCNHHFHCGCISKWLRINATCPLCKSNICRGDTLV
ncbi:E3 ubiquitin-protein ligase At4g11680-like [Benincasa hispida]|uniref:E3 ubiquitin-protein ligase At4g11680-like n=1 Tax=Benincasa hispida TaxID=102211 RepID=UPI0019029279|nr:E3 ubiquitin-protein ligase At4g11680-like [Benincasa hispida]